MHCPICHFHDTKVIDSRLVQDGFKVRRRRECLNEECGSRFTTYEAAEISMPLIVKQNGVREEFSRHKLLGGLRRAIEKRPVSVDSINEIVSNIERRLIDEGDKEVSSGKLGQWVMEQLKLLDHVAYIRFASVYLSFQDVEAFTQTIAELKRDHK